ncbi:MAG: thermonuclease family protein [Neisseriaceae bacterium]|nr:thermonuclease family protein [Neisseriaceae bacterium]
MKKLLNIVGLLFFPCLVFADTQCIAVKVSDGDTFTCRKNGRNMQVRLADIDAPESGQAYGNQARKKLNSLIYKKTVRLTNERQDKYGRVVATVFSGSLNVNLAMIEQGYAWHYERYSNNAEYAAAMRQARKQKRGLWADKGRIVKPEQWRRKVIK